MAGRWLLSAAPLLLPWGSVFLPETSGYAQSTTSQFTFPKSNHVDLTTVWGRVFARTESTASRQRVTGRPACLLCQLRHCPWREGLVVGTRQVSKARVASSPTAAVHLSTRCFCHQIHCILWVLIERLTCAQALLSTGTNKAVVLAIVVLTLCQGHKIKR